MCDYSFPLFFSCIHRSLIENSYIPCIYSPLSSSIIFLMSSPSNVSNEMRELPVGPFDVVVDLPTSRDPRLPVIYVTPDHPLHLGHGKAYYFIYDGTFENAQAVYNLEVNELKIPQGPREEAVQMGGHLFTQRNYI